MILMQDYPIWLFSPACHNVLARESNHSLAGYNVGMCGCGHNSPWSIVSPQQCVDVFKCGYPTAGL